MAIRVIETRESWAVLVTYEIECDDKEEGISDIRESNPERKDFEVISRSVEKIISAELKSEF